MTYIRNEKVLPSVKSEDFIPSVSPWTTLAGISLVATVGTAFTLGSSIKYNVTVKTSAIVRPTGDLRLVQSETEGTIKKIFVKQNQSVKRGDAIALLNNEQLQIKKGQIKNNINQNKLQITQIYAQISSLDAQITAQKKVIERTISSAKADLASNQRDYQEKLVITSSELLAAQANLQQALSNLQKANADLEFAKVDRDRYKQLSQAGAVGRRDYEQRKLAVEQAKLSLKSQEKAVDIAKAKIQSARATLNPSTASVDIAKERIDREIAQGEATIATLLKEKQALIQRRIEFQNQINQSLKDLQQLSNELKSSIIRATSDGIILTLNVSNPGQVVRTGEAVAQIVPQNAPLIIKARISPADIKKVAVEQEVQLRVDACPYPDYGTLKGRLSALAPDAISPPSNSNLTNAFSNNARYFEATIKPKTSTFGRNERKCHLQVGMAATADIISKQETPLQYLLRKARLISDL